MIWLIHRLARRQALSVPEHIGCMSSMADQELPPSSNQRHRILHAHRRLSGLYCQEDLAMQFSDRSRVSFCFVGPGRKRMRKVEEVLEMLLKHVVAVNGFGWSSARSKRGQSNKYPACHA